MAQSSKRRAPSPNLIDVSVIPGENTEVDMYDYLQTLQKTVWAEPEQVLCEAVLRDAVHIYRGGAAIYGGATKIEMARRKRAAAKQDEQWFLDDVESDWVFSFINVCSVLGIDADYLRARVLGIKK